MVAVVMVPDLEKSCDEIFEAENPWRTCLREALLVLLGWETRYPE
jgi:hypothetical protein